MDFDKFFEIKLTSEQHLTIKKAIETIAKQLPYLVSLAPEERDRPIQFSYENVPFILKVRDYINEDPEKIPEEIDIEELLTDTSVIEDLSTVREQLTKFIRTIDDTLTIVGEDSMASAAVYYGYIKYLAKMGSVDAEKKLNDLRGTR